VVTYPENNRRLALVASQSIKEGEVLIVSFFEHAKSISFLLGPNQYKKLRSTLSSFLTQTTTAMKMRMFFISKLKLKVKNATLNLKLPL
jgi:hypothetical protein